jgi:hypothetical protein
MATQSVHLIGCFSGASGKLGEKLLLKRLGTVFAIFSVMGLWGLPIL